MADEFDEWMRAGIEAGWCGPPVCETHDGLPTTEAEEEQFEDGSDPCIHIVRMYEDAEVKAAVEANHSPSVWRNHYCPPKSAKGRCWGCGRDLDLPQPDPPRCQVCTKPE